jgi:ketosteroid isomerase-like protein
VWFAEYLDAWARHDLDAIMASVTDDITHEDVALGRRASGRVAFDRFVRASFANEPDARFELVSFVEDGEAFAAEWTMQPMAIRGASVGRRHGDKVAEQRDYWNIPS